jgi:hypothetical protein
VAPQLGYSSLSAFVRIVEVEKGPDIFATGQTHLSLEFVQLGRGLVAPSSLRKKGIEDDDLLVAGTTTAEKAPIENLRVILFFEGLFHDGFIRDMKESANARVESGAAIVVSGELPLGVKADLVEHAAKENQAADSFAI